MRWFLWVCLVFVSQWVRAEIPDSFQPLVVKPPFSFSERLIDLTPAFQKSQQMKKPMLIYLGAADCPPCKNYTLFLEQHKDELQEALSDVVLVDIRTWLKGPKLTFQIFDKKYSVDEFVTRSGDTRNWGGYPWWWFLNPDGKQVRQLPKGSQHFTKVESHVELIKVPKREEQH